MPSAILADTLTCLLFSIKVATAKWQGGSWYSTTFHFRKLLRLGGYVVDRPRGRRCDIGKGLGCRDHRKHPQKLLDRHWHWTQGGP